MNKILGISGSPIPNSNTDRAVKKILEASGVEYEFIKLSKYSIGPCIACNGCFKEGVCKVNDDFHIVADKMREAKAIVLGTYTPYGLVDGFTKAFLERMWSMHHLKNQNESKLIVTVVSSLSSPSPFFMLDILSMYDLNSIHSFSDIDNETGFRCCVLYGWSGFG